MPRKRKRDRKKLIIDEEIFLTAGKGNDVFVPILGMSWCPNCIKRGGQWVCPQNKRQCVYKMPVINLWSLPNVKTKKPRKKTARVGIQIHKRKTKTKRDLRMQALRFAVYRKAAARALQAAE